MEQEEPAETLFQFETAVQIVYKKPAKHGTQVAIAANVKTFLTTMMKYDPVLSIPALDNLVIYHLNNDEFPSLEDQFKKFFHVHAQSTSPATQNQLTIGCTIHTAKMIKDIKFEKLEQGSFLDWLTLNKIFIKVDTLGYADTQIVGYLLKTHPNITH